MGSAQIMANDVSGRGSSSGSLVASEYVTLFEALGVLNGMKELILAPLVEESQELIRGRATFVLTENASKALSVIFHDSCSSSGPGMNQQDIEAYLRRCGLDRSPVPTQKILDILTKYPSTNGSGSRLGAPCLSLEGFLAYYRDTAQTNEARVRSDLHTFGFRPDLSRRSDEARLESVDGSLVPRPAEESVAIDVSDLLKASDESDNLSELALLGLDVFELHACAYSASEPLAEYLLAATSMDRDVTNLITNTQRAIFRPRVPGIGTKCGPRPQ
ncbi:peptidase [Fragilaria crotonensis]|nr:peptidase [Fragilaria crotonensis]